MSIPSQKKIFSFYPFSVCKLIARGLQHCNNFLCLNETKKIITNQNFSYKTDISDVGMIMMQTGMVKQSVDYTSSIKALDGTKNQITLTHKPNRKLSEKRKKLLKSNFLFLGSTYF